MGMLPALGFNPQNALLDVSPITNAIDGNRRNALMVRESDRQDQELGLRKDQMAYQRGRDQKQDARQEVEWYGKQAMAVDQMPDGPQRQAVWQRIVAKHGADGLTPEEMDHRTGPKIMAAQAGQFFDQRDSRIKDLSIKKTEAEISKLNRTPAGGEVPSNVREWEYFNGMSPEDQQRYITMKRAEKYLDVGTGFVQPNPVQPGENIRTIQKDVAGEEQQKVIGKESGERIMGAPKAQAALASANAKSELVRNKIKEALPMVSQWSSGYGSVLANIPASQAKDLKEKINTIIANMGFEELQDMRANSPTGGALGAIAVQELEMLQKTRASLDQAQSTPQLVKALQELDQFYAGASVRRKQAFDATYGGASRTPAATVPAGNLPDPLGIR